jgi:hypothetical protein
MLRIKSAKPSLVSTIEPWNLCFFAYRRPLSPQITPGIRPASCHALLITTTWSSDPTIVMTYYLHSLDILREPPVSGMLARRRGRCISPVAQQTDTVSLAVNAHQSHMIAIVAERLQTVKLDGRPALPTCVPLHRNLSCATSDSFFFSLHSIDILGAKKRWSALRPHISTLASQIKPYRY